MSTDPDLRRAVAALEAHDLEGLTAALDARPDLVRARIGANANELLGMAAATHDERTVALLLERGADIRGTNVHGWTALHAAAYSGRTRLARLLLDAGAPTSMAARGDGGTPLVFALFWGHGETARLLAEAQVTPDNLRTAAGLDDAARIRELVLDSGVLVAEAGMHRVFHRPHSGFPAWVPSDDPGEVLDEALAWAARNDALAALQVLAERGARLDADVYRGTALAWAAACGRSAALETLLALGADPDARTTFGGPDHGEATTALHLAAGGGHPDAVRVLLAAGADPSARDGRYASTPAGWAAESGHEELQALLDGAAGSRTKQRGESR